MNFETVISIFIKNYLVIFVATMFGAFAHALETVKKQGWKGWVEFLADIVVCSFVGFAFYHLSQLVYPEASIIFTSLGSYWGTKGFVIIREWVVKSVKANL